MLSCVSFAPVPTRPFYSPADGDDPEDVLTVLSIGRSSKYVIPSFEVLAVSMRPMDIKSPAWRGRKGGMIYLLEAIHH